MIRLTHRLAVAVFAAALVAAPARAEMVLRLAMTLSDVPQTTGQASQGGEGIRATGQTMYEGLVRWSIAAPGQPARLVPGLAESWTIDDAKTSWTFHLRHGVKFHDGSVFDADTVVWNFAKLMDRNAPQFDQAQLAQAASYVGSLSGYRKIDDDTVEITTKEPDSTLPYRLVNVMMSSPARWRELGGDWAKFAARPSGTGPWILDKLAPRERVELVRNASYWDAARVPKADRLVLLCMPDASTRVAALLSGQVDIVEALPPDAAPRVKASGAQIVANADPNILHVWPYWLSYAPDSPFRDIRVRKAINLAIDREGLRDLLGGYALPASGMVTPGNPWYGRPSFVIKYDPDEAKRLLKEAGYDAAHPLKLKFVISPSGSGQIQPLPMNEFVQENLRDVGVELTFDIMDWEALRGRRRIAADAPENRGVLGLNNSWNIADPDMGLLSTSASSMRPPAGNNWGLYSDPKADELVAAVKREFDPVKQDARLADLHTYIVDQAMWIWVVHDLAPRALGRNVRGFVPGHNAHQDLTSVYLE